ncbi:diaminopimelate decarboxylase [Thermosulfurimonas sp. F29]|uniref:diaminopimelate decarboxylase n=1 Tax=Thermosulfurimonas sp. F29 TaxID=2867247 RepID=UPI001C83119B|nr:diaminopimelate decarboxylase [Thermosulfurimonas sp. F29]MBX6422566.1 diaminopimelate decarboxylase [Thermosulfurimonas sp. F29]
MHHFVYRQGELFAEEVPVSRIAEEVGTPVYIYSAATLRRHYRVFDEAFSDLPHLVCYSVKANSNLAVLRLLAREGAGADIVSGGELFRALRAGIPPERIVFSGVGKTEREMEEALSAGILMFNVESLGELEALSRVARRLGRPAPFSIRVNPDVDPRTHPYISTGLKKNKFGLPEEVAYRAYLRAKEDPYLRPVGVDCHIGSQLTELSPFVEALRRLKGLYLRLREEGFEELRYLDLGGGLGIVYGEEEPPPPAAYAEAIKREFRDLDAVLVLEPGRVIAGNAGILVTRVLYVKTNPPSGESSEGRTFVIVDAGMNDLIRPTLYQAYHRISPVRERPGIESIRADVVGPICESGDFLARERRLPPVSPGDLLCVFSAGAYGFVMASNYNSRPRAAEVLVDGERYFVVRKREDYEDLVRLEEIPDEL